MGNIWRVDTVVDWDEKGGVGWKNTVDLDGVFPDTVELELEKLPSEAIVVEVVVVVAEIVVVAFEDEFVKTAKGQQSGLSLTHPMKAA
jgi:hypothetical protein